MAALCVPRKTLGRSGVSQINFPPQFPDPLQTPKNLAMSFFTHPVLTIVVPPFNSHYFANASAWLFLWSRRRRQADTSLFHRCDFFRRALPPEIIAPATILSGGASSR
jgi:hypothetical protein